MKIIITEIRPITPALTRFYKYDIMENDEVLLGDQSIECRPSEAPTALKAKLDAFQVEYEVNDLEVGAEII